MPNKENYIKNFSRKTIISSGIKQFLTYLIILGIPMSIACNYSTEVQALETPSILINEILPNPVGSDKGKEWIELYNPSNQIVDISNWEIQIAGTRFSTLFELPIDTIILPYSFYTICGSQINNLCDYSNEKLSIQNGGSETDGIRILDDQENLIDTILYDNPNSNGLVNDSGNVGEDATLAPKVPEGHSLARKTSKDTNNSHDDFIILSQPTLGFINSVVKQDKIHISELSISQGWIELHALSPLTEAYYISSTIDNHQEKILIPIESPYPLFTLDIQSLICNDNESNNTCIEPQSLENNTCINITNSSNQFIDSVCFNSSHEFSKCRILNEDLSFQRFSICEPTRDQANIPLSFSYTTFRDIRNATGLFNESFVKACPITTYQGNTVFYDGDAIYLHNEKIDSGTCVSLSLYKNENSIKTTSIIASIDRTEIDLIPRVDTEIFEVFDYLLMSDLTIENSNGRLSTTLKNDTVMFAQDDGNIYEQIISRLTKNDNLSNLKVSNLEAILIPFSTDSLNSTKLALIPLQVGDIEEIIVPENLASTGVHFSYTLIAIIVILAYLYHEYRNYKQKQIMT